MRATANAEAAAHDIRNRWLRVFIRVGLAIVVGWIVMVSAKVLFQSQGDIQSRSDAMVSLAPLVHRLYAATRLVEAGHTDMLLVSHFDGDVGVSDAGQSGNQVSVTDYCDAHEGNGVRCFIPNEVVTISEAFAVSGIEAQESWETLTVVTSRSHAFRARYLFNQCVRDDMRMNFGIRRILLR